MKRTWLSSAFIAALAASTGCGAAPQTPEPQTSSPQDTGSGTDSGKASGTASGAEGPTTPAEGRPDPGPPTGGKCSANRVFDWAVKGCRLYPGGGNGWAGCAAAEAPQNNERCVTGTHWAKGSCDCACDVEGQRWDPEKKACQ